jgi:septal ring factor EnvC (AmiA/AmiB activator)
MRSLLPPPLAGKFVILGVFLLPVSAYSLDDANAPAYREKLGELQKSIDLTQQDLKGTRNRRSHIIVDLKKLESNISKNARALKSTEKTIGRLNKHIAPLKKKLKKLSIQLHHQRTALAEQMRSAYALGSQQNLKIILNQQNLAELGRQQVYFNYFSQARQQEILQFMDAIKTQQGLEKDLKQSLAAQKTAFSKRKHQRNILQEQRLKRNQLLVQLEKKINNQEQTLSELQNSRTKIEDLLMSLGKLLADVPAAPGDGRPFAQQKGQLPWPVKGRFLSRYGQNKEQGGLKWNGVLIGAPYGTPVRAISHGRVAFADWLQGFGFISIIDHGDGYMSLYGHNESLLKQPGDWVKAGEEIATTGDSGGQPVSGLYFEIRFNGKPINPKSWCSKKVRHAKSP